MKQKRKFPKSEELAVDQIVYNLFCKARNKAVPISVSLLKEKALEVASTLEMENFAASKGLLESFCKRHNITFKSIHSESAEVNLDYIED